MIVTIAETPEDIAQCLALRHAIFIVEQGVSEAEERDGQDDLCTHVLARADGQAVGTARVNWSLTGIAKIQRVCVAADFRDRGVGGTIMRFIIAHVRKTGRASVIRLGSQTHALDFYRKLGFSEFGEIYMDAGIPHRDMEMTL